MLIIDHKIEACDQVSRCIRLAANRLYGLAKLFFFALAATLSDLLCFGLLCLADFLRFVLGLLS